MNEAAFQSLKVLTKILELLDLHICRRPQTARNTADLKRAAHQKLPQESAFVIEEWSNVFALNQPELTGTSAAFDALQPTQPKIIHSVTFHSDPNALKN